MRIKAYLMVVVIISLVVANLAIAPDKLRAHADSCRSTWIYIDVFTQNPRYDGKGQNQPADMFGPQDLVILYALVRIDGKPLVGKLVSYEITGPPKTSNLTFYQVAATNDSGISETLFSLRIINHTDAFGLWSVTARVDVAGNGYSDTLIFQCDWLIELISVTTLDGNLTERNTFGIDGYVGVDIVVRNNAWTPKTTRLGVTLFDELNVPLASFEVANLTIPPDGKSWVTYGKLFIPRFGVPGRSMITVVALDANGAAYCPEMLTVFWITIQGPISVDFVDGAVFLDVWPVKAEPGEIISVTLVVRNEGTITLNYLNVTFHIDGSSPVNQSISSLKPYASYTYHENWNTTGLPEGNYTITADIQTFPNEADLSDNNCTTVVELKRTPICTHDIQVSNVTCSTNEVYQGQTVDIAVTVRNNGNSIEATNVRAYYDASLIYEQNVMEFSPGTEQVLIFHWDTAGVPVGFYPISATATPVEGETHITDNTYIDGSVRIIAPPQTIHDVAIIALSPNPNDTLTGYPVAITTRVKNLGNLTESFTVRYFYDSAQIGESYVSNLAPNEEREQVIIWNTMGVPEGSYTIKAYIPALPDETNTTNNVYVDGTVLIRAIHPPTAKHDVAITAVNASTYHANVGANIAITVTAANVGDFPETFNVTLYADTLKIGTRSSLHLEPNSSAILSFSWNTSGLTAGNYSLWAFADYVEGETNTANNLFVDGTVTLVNPSVYYVHDVAVIAVQPDRQSVFVGQEAKVTMRVKNYGNATEDFNVTLYYDSTPIGATTVYSLAPAAEQTLLFEWNTSNVGVGNYTLKAHAEPVPGEANLENNWFTDGAVEVQEAPPSVIHDIAVAWLSANTTEANAGENVTIEAIVQNLGSVPESFNVTIYYGSNLIQTIPVESLAPNSSLSLTTIWNTRSVQLGTYVLNANATILPGEVNTQNNYFEDGQVSIRLYSEIPFWVVLIAFLIGLILLALLLLLLLLRRRKKRSTAMPAYGIISHPHI